MCEPAENWAAASCAALLHQGPALHGAALILSLPAFGHALADASASSCVIALAAIVALAAETYFAVRTGIDARLFDRLAADQQTGASALADLDRGLGLAGLAPHDRVRTLAERIAGARQLWRKQLIATLLVLLSAIAALLHTVAA